MRATAGDRIVVHAQRIGEANRVGEILEVHGEQGAPPFVVRWRHDGHVATYFPGADASIQPRDEPIPTPRTAADGGPVRLDVLAALASMRADVTRLRAALARFVGVGDDARRLAAASLSRSIGQVECELAALGAEVKAGQADTVGAIRTALDDAVRSVRTVLDDLRVQAHLGSSEADDAWQLAVGALRRLRDDPTMPLDAARSVASDAVARLRSALS